MLSMLFPCFYKIRKHGEIAWKSKETMVKPWFPCFLQCFLYQGSMFACLNFLAYMYLGSIRFSSTKSTDSTFNLHCETNGKRLKRLTWLIETISVDMSMGNRGKCKQRL